MISVNAKRRLSEWFHQWRLPLRRFLLRNGGIPAADVEDVGQEVFLRLMRYETAELIDHPQAYLYKVASNVATEWSTRARNRLPHDDQWLNDLIHDEEAELQVMRSQAEREIERALDTLTPYQREVLRLFFHEELGYIEIAARLDESVRSVTRQFRKSYEKLRQEIDPKLLGVYTHGRE